MKNTWVLVADEAIARILQWQERGTGLDSVEEITDPDAHSDEAEFRRDAQGRRAGAAPHSSSDTPHRLRGAASVTASAGEDAQHLEGAAFARRIADHLAEALRDKRFDELQIVAAPRFLGALRKALSVEVRATVSTETDKDLIHLDNRDLATRLYTTRTATQ